jgi:hypothetical protein
MTGPPTAAPSRYPAWVAPVRAVIITAASPPSCPKARAAEAGVRTPAAAPTSTNRTTAVGTERDPASRRGMSAAIATADPTTRRRDEYRAPPRPTWVAERA